MKWSGFEPQLPVFCPFAVHCAEVLLLFVPFVLLLPPPPVPLLLPLPPPPDPVPLVLRLVPRHSRQRCCCPRARSRCWRRPWSSGLPRASSASGACTPPGRASGTAARSPLPR